jgi:hypothetical protein
VQIIAIAIPLSSEIVPWKKDSEGRSSADIPGVGTLVELSPAEADAARERAKEMPDPIPLGFDLSFADGRKGLFMRADEAPSVPKAKALSGR